MIFKKMKNFQFHIEKAFNGKELIERLQNSVAPISMILMDFDMPIMNGIDATKNIKKLAQSNIIKEIPVIGVTGTEDEEEIKNAREAGMVDIVVKPISEAKIHEIIEKYVLKEEALKIKINAVRD